MKFMPQQKFQRVDSYAIDTQTHGTRHESMSRQESNHFAIGDNQGEPAARVIRLPNAILPPIQRVLQRVDCGDVSAVLLPSTLRN